MYVHVVAKLADGILIRGDKVHQIGALNSHWILVMPTISMSKDDADYAVSFVASVGAEGIFIFMAVYPVTPANSEVATLMLGKSRSVDMKP